LSNHCDQRLLGDIQQISWPSSLKRWAIPKNKGVLTWIVRKQSFIAALAE
jgi:hypothetical protein